MRSRDQQSDKYKEDNIRDRVQNDVTTQLRVRVRVMVWKLKIGVNEDPKEE
jgi:hypothetical protein